MKAKCFYHPEKEINFFCECRILLSLEKCTLPMCINCLPIHENDHLLLRQPFEFKNINDVIKHVYFDHQIQNQIQFKLYFIKEIDIEIKKMYKNQEQQFIQKIQNIKQICFNKIEQHINNIINRIQQKKLKQNLRQQIQNHQSQLQNFKEIFSKNLKPKDIIEYKNSKFNQTFDKLIYLLQSEKDFFSVQQIFIQPQVLQNFLKSFISLGQIKSNEKLTKNINQWKKHKQQSIFNQKNNLITNLKNRNSLLGLTPIPKIHQKKKYVQIFKNHDQSKFYPVIYDKGFYCRNIQKKIFSDQLTINSPKFIKQQNYGKRIKSQKYQSQEKISKQLFSQKFKDYPMTTSIINKLFQKNENYIDNKTYNKIKNKNNNNIGKKYKSLSDRKNF